jgi:hypothetical protein
LELGRGGCPARVIDVIKVIASIGKVLGSIGIGALGGWICGFLILSFGYYVGRSGDYPSEGFGYWNPVATFGLAGFYGMPLGAIIFPIGYWIFLQNAPSRRVLVFTLAGTLLGGLCGALIDAPVAALAGVVGFFVGTSFAGSKGHLSA